MPGYTTLAEVDHYLRAIWLECCGHLSKFSKGGWFGGKIKKNRKVEDVFKKGVELTHTYDFGTETVTLLRVVETRRGKPDTRRPIVLMARNAPLAVDCQECEKQASAVCIECIYGEDLRGTLCGEHSETHPHDEYGGPRPIVNSPRVATCGYYGPAVPPY